MTIRHPEEDEPVLEEERVMITGTRHHGFTGTVKESQRNGYMIELDEWPGVTTKFYHHNIMLVTQ